MSFTVGKKGFHLNFSKRGVRQTVGLPGSGISHTSYLYKNDSDEEDTEKEKAESEEPLPAKKRRRTRTKREEAGRASSPWGFFLFTAIAVFVIYVAGVSLGLLPPANFITQFLEVLSNWTHQIGL